MTEYRFPDSVAEALDLLHDYTGRALVIAGGTDVLPDIRRGKRAPDCLVDVTRIPGLDQIRVSEARVEVGAAVTFAAIQAHPDLARLVPALTDAARSVGAASIQTAATWVGNVVQAMPAADGAIIALALETEARVAARVAARVVAQEGQTVQTVQTEWRPVETLFLGPGRSAVDPTRQIVTHLRFPIPRQPWGSAWRRIGRRDSLTLPILNCAVKVVLDARAQVIEYAVIALGPVAPRPFRAREAEASLAHQQPTDEVLSAAAQIAQGEANPRDSLMRASRAYRLSVIPVLAREALHEAVRRAQESELDAFQTI